jgi:hypothetical protein
MRTVVKKKKIAKVKKPTRKRKAEKLLPDMGNHPYFVKKAEEAIADLIKYGVFPED